MKVVCVYKRETDYGREVEEFLNEIARKGLPSEIEVLNPEEMNGEIFAQAHDIVRYPAIVAVDERGAELQRWVGLPLPAMDEIVYYLNS